MTGMSCSRVGGVRNCIAAATALSTVACGGPDDGRPAIAAEDSAGVAIVRNDGVDRPLDWRVEDVLRLGGTDEGPEAFFQIFTPNIGADAEGRIYALDTGNRQVQVFDGDGGHLRTMGGHGGGPGELMDPVAFLVEPEGGVQILDWGKGTVVRFAEDGSVGTEIRGPAPMYRPALLAPGHVLGTVEIAVGSPETVAPGTPFQQRIMLVRRTGDTWEEPVALVVLEFERPAFTLDGPEDCPMRVHTPPIFSVQPVWRASAGRVLYSATAEYVVNIADADGRTTSVRRDLPVVAATRELAAAEIGPMNRTLGDVTCEMSAEARADQVGWADRVSWIRDFAMSPAGSLFVRRRAPGQQPPDRIDVFDPDGVYSGTLPPDFDLPHIWRSHDEFLRIETDDVGRSMIVVYRLIRSSSGG